MEKIKLEIAGLSYSQTQTGAYALVLVEAGGKRQLPIIIGGFEAQAIAIQLEKMTPTRPLTHDLFKSLGQAFAIEFHEVVIYDLKEGIFYAKIICEQDGVTAEIDARTSDAIAIGVRFNCPIYTFEFILSTAGSMMNEEGEVEPPAHVEEEIEDEENHPTDEQVLELMDPNELETQLQDALDNEDYELASKIRDEINRRTK
jgi:bifunctional DNase/RNase